MTATTFRKRPVVTAAVQLRWTQWQEVCELLGDALLAENMGGAGIITADEASDTCGECGPQYIALNVRTAHGEVAIVRHGDWILPEKQPGRFYPCKPDVFATTYEACSAPAAAHPVPVLWFCRKGLGPSELALEVHRFASALAGAIPASLMLRVRAVHDGMVMPDAARGVIDGGFNLEREQVAELHRQLGAWLAGDPQ